MISMRLRAAGLCLSLSTLSVGVVATPANSSTGLNRVLFDEAAMEVGKPPPTRNWVVYGTSGPTLIADPSVLTPRVLWGGGFGAGYFLFGCAPNQLCLGFQLGLNFVNGKHFDQAHETSASLTAYVPEAAFTVTSRHLLDWLSVIGKLSASLPYTRVAYALGREHAAVAQSDTDLSGVCAGGSLASTLELFPNQPYGNVGIGIEAGRTWCNTVHAGGLHLGEAALKVDLSAWSYQMRVFQRF